MPQASTNATFKNSALPNVHGVEAVTGQTLSVEFLTADPTDLATTSPRVWVNVTTGIMKYTTNAAGTPVKVKTAT